MLLDRARSILAACLITAAGWTAALAQQPAAGPGGQRGQPPQIGTGFIAGQVVESASGAGVGGATVILGGRGGPTQPVIADSQGRFFFAALPPLTYTAQANAPGYLVTLGRPVELAGGERVTNMKIRLVKYGAISGSVRDDAGDPVVGIDVRALRRALSNGRRTLSIFGRTKTDDRGAYHFANLPPADYFVCACGMDPIPFDGVLLSTLASEPLQMMGVAARALTAGADVASIDNTLRTIAPTFYPSSATTARATAVKVTSGAEKAGVDIEAPAVRATRVSGIVTGAAGPLDASGIGLTPAGESAEATTLVALPPMLVQPDGHFDFAGVPPGQYVLNVFSIPRPGAAGAPSGLALQFIGGRGGAQGGSAMTASGVLPSNVQPMWASEPITVGDDGASGLTIALHRAIVASGKVEFVGSAAQPTQRGVVYLQALDPTAPGFGSPVGLIGPDGTFQIVNLVPGRYSIVSNGAPRWPTLKSVVVNGVDLTDLPIVVESSDIPGIAITYIDTPLATLGGTVAGSQSGPDVRVLVFPVDRKYWPDPSASSRRFKTSVVSRGGSYTISALAPGEYFVAVVTDDEAVDWIDPSKLEAWSRGAARVQLADGDKKILDLKR